jgi:hypothetical protein
MIRQRDPYTAAYFRRALIGAIDTAPEGAPGAVLAATCYQVLGLAQHRFDSIMRGLVATGRVQRKGDLFFPGRKVNGDS